MKRNLSSSVVLACVAGLIFLFVRPDYRQGEPSIHGRRAMDFPLTIDGKPGKLSDLRGRVVLLNFWATWCPPCVEEAPSLVELQREIAPLGGTVLGVSLDDDQEAYENFLRAHNINFPTYRDTTKRIAADYGTHMYPETYVIDRRGRFDRKIIGPQDWNTSEMWAYLDSVLKEK